MNTADYLHQLLDTVLVLQELGRDVSYSFSGISKRLEIFEMLGDTCIYETSIYIDHPHAKTQLRAALTVLTSTSVKAAHIRGQYAF